LGSCHVLIISTQRLFIESLTRLIQNAGEFVVTGASDLSTLDTLPADRSKQIIIIDYSELIATEEAVISQVTAHNPNYQVIFLTPVDDEMVIYYRQQRRDSRPENLIEFLKPPH
jgi:DNA-binding NarL/FixJ family response regulator